MFFEKTEIGPCSMKIQELLLMFALLGRSYEKPTIPKPRHKYRPDDRLLDMVSPNLRVMVDRITGAWDMVG